MLNLHIVHMILVQLTYIQFAVCSICLLFNFLLSNCSIVQLTLWQKCYVLLDFCSIVFGQLEMCSGICSAHLPPGGESANLKSHKTTEQLKPWSRWNCCTMKLSGKTFIRIRVDIHMCSSFLFSSARLFRCNLANYHTRVSERSDCKNN